MEYKNVTIDLFTATLSFSLQSVKDPYGLFIKKSSTEQKIELCRKVKLDHSVFEHIVVYCAWPIPTLRESIVQSPMSRGICLPLSQLLPVYPALQLHLPSTLLQLSELACTHVQVDAQLSPNLKLEQAIEENVFLQ